MGWKSEFWLDACFSNLSYNKTYMNKNVLKPHSYACSFPPLTYDASWQVFSLSEAFSVYRWMKVLIPWLSSEIHIILEETYGEFEHRHIVVYDALIWWF